MVVRTGTGTGTVAASARVFKRESKAGAIVTSGRDRDHLTLFHKRFVAEIR